jgi:hypothetical protein
MCENIEPEVRGDLYLIPLPKTGCHLAIYRRELMSNLPDDLLVKCLNRAKGIKRREASRKREGKTQEQEFAKF